MSRVIVSAITLIWTSQLFLAAQSLEVWIGSRKQEVDSRSHSGANYYELSDLVRVLGLGFEESGGRAFVSGPRGKLELTPSRPLVGAGRQYILLSSEVWLRGRGDWWVPADFLDRALPVVLDQEVIRVSDRAIRLRGFQENRVRLQAFSYPDHLSLVFTSSQPAKPDVREFRDHIEVVYTDYLTRVDLMAKPARDTVVSDVRFLPDEGLGAFNIVKGREFDSFRERRLADPDRLVLDLYGRAVVTSRSPEPPPSPAPPGRDAVTEDAPVDETDPTTRPFRYTQERASVVIDPGHGGEDYGVEVRLDLLEKGLALELGRRVGELLQARGESVELTRSRDISLGIEQRSAVANRYRPRAFIGIHFGGSPSPSIRGPIVYVLEGNPRAVDPAVAQTGGEREFFPRWEEAQLAYLNDSRRLATLLQSRLNQMFEVENRVLAIPLEVLAPVGAPAVVVEFGFLTSEHDRALLSNPQFREQLAQLVADTLMRFIAS